MSIITRITAKVYGMLGNHVNQQVSTGNDVPLVPTPKTLSAEDWLDLQLLAHGTFDKAHHTGAILENGLWNWRAVCASEPERQAQQRLLARGLVLTTDPAQTCVKFSVAGQALMLRAMQHAQMLRATRVA